MGAVTANAQRVLVGAGATIEIDGYWGPKTQAAYDSASITAQAEVRQLFDVLGKQYPWLRRGPIGSNGGSMAAVSAAIRAECARRGYASAEFVVAQAAHESAFGRSQLAARYNNFGGLKSGVRPNKANGTIEFNTREGYGSNASVVKAPFLTFASVEDWVVTELDFLERKTKGAIKGARTAREYNELLRAAGYYTGDPKVYLAALERGTMMA